jgi:hypothetical protein
MIGVLLAAAFVFYYFKPAFTVPMSEQSMFGASGSGLRLPTPTTAQDVLAPSVPGGPQATIDENKSVELTWAPSNDNFGIAGYTVYRNGVSLAITTDTNFRDTNIQPDATYNYAIDAFDQAGNHSAISATLSLTTDALPGSLIFLLPEADTYVNAQSPTVVYGFAESLRADTSPDIHAYLRFNVSGLNGKSIKRARLLLFTKSSAPQGIRVMAVADNNWAESKTTFNYSPAATTEIGVSPAAPADSWIALDVTSYITGEGKFSFAIFDDSMTAISLVSREAGSNAPQLILDLH